MNAVDSMLDGDEPIVQRIAAHDGPWVAQQFVRQFNNACAQMAGFETDMEALSDQPSCFLAPMYNLSKLEN